MVEDTYVCPSSTLRPLERDFTGVFLGVPLEDLGDALRLIFIGASSSSSEDASPASARSSWSRSDSSDMLMILSLYSVIL